MTERPDLHAWASAEATRRTVAGTGTGARWRVALWQTALVALIAGATCSLILFCVVLQQIWLLGSLLQAAGASYWAGIVIWTAIATTVLLPLFGVLSRWWLLLPLALLGWDAWLVHDSVRRAEAIAAGWRFEAGMGGRLAAPLPVPRGTPPLATPPSASPG